MVLFMFTLMLSKQMHGVRDSKQAGCFCTSIDRITSICFQITSGQKFLPAVLADYFCNDQKAPKH